MSSTIQECGGLQAQKRAVSLIENMHIMWTNVAYCGHLLAQHNSLLKLYHAYVNLIQKPNKQKTFCK